MSSATEQQAIVTENDLEFATFHVGNLLLGIDIHDIQEIGRQLDLTPVPHAPECVRGVVNLRGEVVTVLDLRTMLGIEPAELTGSSRNLIVNAGGERIGLLVDRMADVVIAPADDIEPPPPNLPLADASALRGVYRLEHGLLGVLAVQELLATEN